MSHDTITAEANILRLDRDNWKARAEKAERELQEAMEFASSVGLQGKTLIDRIRMGDDAFRESDEVGDVITQQRDALAAALVKAYRYFTDEDDAPEWSMHDAEVALDQHAPRWREKK